MSGYLDIARRVAREHPRALKGRAVELWRAGERFFIVADDKDRALLVDRGMGSRGETWTAREIELIAQIQDKEFRDDIEHWKRVAGGKIRAVVPHREM